MHEQRTSISTAGAAVLIVDMQNDFCHPEGVFAKAGLVLDDSNSLMDRINGLVNTARMNGLPIIWIRMEWPDDVSVGKLADRSPFLRTEGLRRNTWGSQLMDTLDVNQHDHHVAKMRFSGFYDTDLNNLLRRLDIDTLIMTGVRTDFCIESTTRDAFFRDFDVIVAEDGVAGYREDLHSNSLQLMNTVFASILPVDDIESAFAKQ